MSIPLDIAPLKIVENSNPPGMEVLSFGVKLPSEMFRRHPEGPEASNVGVVGTITLFAQKSAMIWFGFGSLTTSRDEKDANVGSGKHSEQETYTCCCEPTFVEARCGGKLLFGQLFCLSFTVILVF